ncbi:MAG: SdrD B-like domain-containing protein [Caldilineaceae bacterium]
MRRSLSLATAPGSNLTRWLSQHGVITPVAGMTIVATNGASVYTTTTNANGYYSFTTPAGIYTVTYGSVPASYGTVVASSNTPGGNSEAGNVAATSRVAPDQSHVNGTTVSLVRGEANWHVDFAFTISSNWATGCGSRTTRTATPRQVS